MSLENRVQNLEADKQASKSPLELTVKDNANNNDFSLIINSDNGEVERTPYSSNFGDGSEPNIFDNRIISLDNTNDQNTAIQRVVQSINQGDKFIVPLGTFMVAVAFYTLNGRNIKQTWILKNRNRPVETVNNVTGYAYGGDSPDISLVRGLEQLYIAETGDNSTSFGDIGNTTPPETPEEYLSDFVNALDPSEGLVNGQLITATIDGIDYEWNFSGDDGDYGLNGDQSTATDFNRYDTGAPVDAEQRIDTLKPFNYLIESTKDPVLIEASVGGWDETLRELGNYFTDDDGSIYQLYTGHTGASGVNSRLGIARSTDGGETFQKAGINNEGMMFDTPSEDPHMYKVGKTYYLYSEESSNNAKKIQLHTCTNLLDNSWVSQGIVIDTGFPDDDWDGESVGSPMGLYKDGMHIVFYEGLNQSRYQYGQIGVATGVDPTNLTKQASPIIIGKDFKEKFPNLFQGEVTVPWANTVVCDDIYESNGIHYMTIHANTKGFKPAVLYSKDLFDGWTDLLGGYIGNNGDLENNRDIMFSPYNGEMRVTKISQDRKRITRAELSVQGDYTLKNRPFESDGEIISNGEIKSENLISVNDAIAMNGQGFYANDKDAHDNGVEWNEVYHNEFKIPVIRKEVFNLFPDSEPTAASASTTLVDFDWGVNGFTKALQTGDNSSQTGFTAQLNVVSGVRYNFSCYVKMDDDTAPVYYPQSNVIISDFILYVAGNFQDIPTNIEDLGNNIYRVSANAKATATGSRLFGISKFTTNSPRPFKTYGFQATRGEYVNDYRPTYNPQNDNQFKDLRPVQKVGEATQTIESDTIEIKGNGSSTRGFLEIDTIDGTGRPIIFKKNGQFIGGIDYNFTAKHFSFDVVDANGNRVNDAFVIKSEADNNYLGLGTSDPQEQLDINGNGIADSFITRPVTVANLPTGQQGMYATVTDALAPTSGGVIVGGGTDTRPIHHNGTDWISLY